jgi:hypothetical protein
MRLKELAEDRVRVGLRISILSYYGTIIEVTKSPSYDTWTSCIIRLDNLAEKYRHITAYKDDGPPYFQAFLNTDGSLVYIPEQLIDFP